MGRSRLRPDLHPQPVNAVPACAIGGAGGTSIYDRDNTGNVRADGRPWAASAGRRSVVLSLTRHF